MDSKELKKRIDAHGFKIRFLAEKLGISHESMYNKVKGRTEFKVSEVSILSDILELSDSDIRLIFFGHKVV